MAMCSSMVVETIEYYVSNKSSVYLQNFKYVTSCFRPWSRKAFDLLISKVLTCIPILQWKWDGIKLIQNRFIHYTMKWSRVTVFINRIYINIYIDGLLERTKSAAIGCHIGRMFVGDFGWADDLVLIALAYICWKSKWLLPVRSIL